MVVIAFLLPLGWLLHASAHERLVTDAEVAARALAPVVAVATDVSTLDAAVSLAAARVPGRLSVHLAGSRTLGEPAVVDHLVAAALEGHAAEVRTARSDRILVPVVRTNGDIAAIEVAVARDVLPQGVGTAWAILGGLGVTLIVLAAWVADRLGRSTVAAVQTLGEVAARLGAGDLDARADVDDPPEVAAVAGVLTDLGGRIRELMARERETVADLSHRLRTPLMALRLDLERLPLGAERHRLQRDVQRLEQAVDLVIQRARQGHGSSPQAGPVDLGEVARSRVTFWRVLAEDQGRSVTLALPRPAAPINLSEDETEAVIDALIGNVIVHTPPGTDLRVAVEASPGASTLIVEDDGPGFAAPDPSARGESRSGSTGLGLDIVRQAVERTGGNLTIGTGHRGGARVVATFGPPHAAIAQTPWPSAGGLEGDRRRHEPV